MTTTEPTFARGDRGKGSFSDYAGLLVPRNARVSIRLAGSDPFAATIAELASLGELETAIARRSREAEAKMRAGGQGFPPKSCEPAATGGWICSLGRRGPDWFV